MTADALADKLSCLTGNDRREAMGQELIMVQDECTTALVRLARIAHGDQPTIDAMEGLALAIDRVTAVRYTIEHERFADDPLEATR